MKGTSPTSIAQTAPRSGARKIAEAQVERVFDLFAPLRGGDGPVSKRALVFPDEVTGAYESWARSFTPEEIRLAASKMESLLFGKIAQLPMTCPGHQTCPYASTCPYMPKEPVGKGCPVEAAFVVDRMRGLKQELTVDAFRETDFLLVSRLIELELMDMRITAKMSRRNHWDPLVEVAAGSTPDGQIYYKDEENPLFALKEKINREKTKLLNTLVETPEARWQKAAALREVTKDAYQDKLKKLSDLVDKATRAVEQKGS